MKLERFYALENGTYLVELKLPDIRRLFNSLDPAPFLEKDLDEEAALYIVEAFREIGASNPAQLVIYLPEELMGSPQATDLPLAIRNYFDYRWQIASRDLRNKLNQGRISLVIGLIFLFLCLSSRELLTGSPLGSSTEILREGLLISGWVAMWRPIQILLYDWWPIQELRNVYRKISSVDIRLHPLGE